MLRGMSAIDYVPAIAIAVMLVASALSYAFLPEVVIVHWNFALQPDGFARKLPAVLVLPILGLGLICMQLIGRYVAHEGSAPLHFSKAIIFAMPILAIAHIGVIAIALASGHG